MIHFKYSFFLIISISSQFLSSLSQVTTTTTTVSPIENTGREGRGILDTIQSVVQTVQTVNKLFGSSSSNTNPLQNNYNNGVGSFPVNYPQSQPQYQPQQQYQQYQQSQIVSSQYGTVPEYQSPPSQIYNPTIQGQVQPQQNYQSFPVGTTLNFNNNNNNGFYPGTVSNVVNPHPHPSSPVHSVVNKQGAVGSSNLLSSVGELGILEDLTDLFSLTNVEKVLNNVNKFDSLQCIPRIVCQTIAKRTQEAAEKERMSTTTTTTTRRPKSRGNKNRNGRFIPGFKIKGVDTALEQFVKFLDLMQLKDWSVYPYLQGAYHGNSVKSSDECAEKFSTCPFSEDQLLYYFNNYKGGLFQSFRSDLQRNL